MQNWEEKAQQKRRLNAAKSLFRQFAQQTSIDGFTKILNAIHSTEALFWGVLLVTGFCMTIRDCATPIRGYITEETYSVVELQRNGTITFPGATLCVQIYIELLTPRNETRLMNIDRIEAFRACLLSPICHQQSDFFDRFYDEIVAAAKLLWSYIAVENGETVQFLNTNMFAFQVPLTFYQFLANSNISSTALLQILGYTFCTKMRFKAIYMDKNENVTTDNFCDVGRLTWFGVPPFTVDEIENMCYTVENITHFKGYLEYHSLSFFPQAIYPNPPAEVNSYLNFEDDPICSDRSSHWLKVQSKLCTRVKAEFVAQMTSLPKQRSPCSTYYSVVECIGFCRVRALVDHCNCSSLAWETVIAYREDAPPCFSALSPREFEACGAEAKQLATQKSCKKKCNYESERCRTPQISLDQGECYIDKTHYRPGSTTVEVLLKSFNYLAYDERFTYELPVLISNVGGIAGLWLGAGFIGIIHAFTFPLRLCAMRFSRWKDDEEEGTLSLKKVETKRLEDLITKLVEERLTERLNAKARHTLSFS